jgi:uncharacterized protein
MKNTAYDVRFPLVASVVARQHRGPMANCGHSLTLVVNNSYQQLVGNVDRMTSALTARYSRHLQCRAGCSGCCHHHIAVFRVEAEAMSEAIASLPAATRSLLEAQARTTLDLESRGEAPICPLLVDDKCSIYDHRPIICRTQGLPLLIKSDDDEDEVDWCPLNFTSNDAEQDLDEKHLVHLDELNFELALVNLTHSRSSGIPDEESGHRCTVAEIILNLTKSK